MVGLRYATTALLDLAQNALDARRPIRLCAVLALRQMQQELGRGLVVLNAKPRDGFMLREQAHWLDDARGDEHGCRTRWRLGQQTREHAPILATTCRVRLR